MSIRDGTFLPPRPRLVSLMGFRQALDVPVDLDYVCLYAGAQMDDCSLRLPTIYAEPGSVSMGGRARVYLGSDLVFRGVVATAPMTISEDGDELRLVLLGEKWLLGRKVVGQPDIGTVGDGWQRGFRGIGQDIVFNAEGRPNRLAGQLDFSTAPGAVFWSYRAILEFLDEYYFGSDFSLSAATLDEAFDRAPSHLSLVGQTVLQALDTVFGEAGQSWAARPSTARSNVRAVRPGAGRLRTIRLFTPGRGARITQATAWTADDVQVGLNVVNVRDLHVARSAPVVVEHTYSSAGDNPLLVRQETFRDMRYEALWAVDVTQYAVHGLGAALPAGSRPKQLMRELVTRRGDGDASYLTAADIAADPQLAANDKADIPVWVSADGDSANAALVTGGYELDLVAGTIAFEAAVELLQGDGSRVMQDVDWEAAAIWVTLATQLEYAETAVTDENNRYLADSMYRLLDRPDLQPERRRAVWLPDPVEGGINQVAPNEEVYIDVSGILADYVQAAAVAMPDVERHLTLELPFMPRPQIGDRIRLSGRPTDAQGDEVTTALRFDGQRSSTQLEATNVVAGMAVPSEEVD